MTTGIPGTKPSSSAGLSVSSPAISRELRGSGSFSKGIPRAEAISSDHFSPTRSNRFVPDASE